jgi:hypothetical protein
MNAAFFTNLRCPTEQRKIEYQDRRTSGLILEVRDSGLLTFAFRYRDELGVRRQYMIGRYPRIGYILARREAERLQEDLDFGIFPSPQPKSRHLSRQQWEVIRIARLEVADALDVPTTLVGITAACF